MWGKDWGKPDFKYPYTPDSDPEDLKAGNEMPHVLRGGASDFSQMYVRCAYRFGSVPHHRYDFIGFRVVLSPVYSEL